MVKGPEVVFSRSLTSVGGCYVTCPSALANRDLVSCLGTNCQVTEGTEDQTPTFPLRGIQLRLPFSGCQWDYMKSISYTKTRCATWIDQSFQRDICCHRWWNEDKSTKDDLHNSDSRSRYKLTKRRKAAGVWSLAAVETTSNIKEPPLTSHTWTPLWRFLSYIFWGGKNKTTRVLRLNSGINLKQRA